MDNDLRIFTWPTGGHCDDDDDEEEDEDGEGRGYVAPASVQAQLFGIPAVFLLFKLYILSFCCC